MSWLVSPSCLRSPVLGLSIRAFTRSLVTAAPKKTTIVKKKDVARKAKAADAGSNDIPLLEAVAYCTSDRYDLSSTRSSLKQDYKLRDLPDVTDALIVDSEGSDGRIFVFNVGAVVFWNIDPVTRQSFLQRLDVGPWINLKCLDSEEVERESMDYRIDAEGRKTRIGSKGEVVLTGEQDPLDQYSVSHAMSLSVKLATYESSLDRFADSVQHVAESMAAGQKLALTRTEVFQKVGQLFKLRHDINLGVDLLDTPDFYWDREQLETLFRQACSSLSISKRTRLMNERLSYCYELMELLTSHLNQEHNTKLEWMIIWLIAIEVLFEVIHFADKSLAH